MEDIYQISRRVGAGAFNSLFISGRAGTGKTYNVERALRDEGLVEDEDYVLVSGAASVIMMYKKFFQYKVIWEENHVDHSNLCHNQIFL